MRIKKRWLKTIAGGGSELSAQVHKVVKSLAEWPQNRDPQKLVEAESYLSGARKKLAEGVDETPSTWRSTIQGQIDDLDIVLKVVLRLNDPQQSAQSVLESIPQAVQISPRTRSILNCTMNYCAVPNARFLASYPH